MARKTTKEDRKTQQPKPPQQKETKEQRRQRRQLAQVAKPRSYYVRTSPSAEQHKVDATFTVDGFKLDTNLNGKNIACHFVFGESKVPRKVKMYGKVVRTDQGKPITVEVPLPATTATLTIDGQSFSSMSCCKPPDRQDRRTGIKIALRHLLKKPEVHKMLKGEEFEVVAKMCLTKPPRPGQIKRNERQRQGAAGQTTQQQK